MAPSVAVIVVVKGSSNVLEPSVMVGASISAFAAKVTVAVLIRTLPFAVNVTDCALPVHSFLAKPSDSKLLKLVPSN